MTTISGTEPIPAFGIDSAGLTPDQVLALWRDTVLSFFDVDIPEGAEPFQAEVTSYAMGGMLFARARSTEQIFTRSPATIARIGVDHVIVQLYMAGGYEGVAGERPIVVGPGDICVLDLGQTLKTHARAFENLTLILPREAFERKVAHPERLHGLVVSSDSVLGEILGRHLKTLFELAPRMTFDDCDAISAGTTSLIVACLKGEIEERDAEEALAPAASIIKLRRFIAQNLADPRLSADMIGEHFGISRASLYRLFEPIGGVAEHIRARRLHQAFYDLTTPNARPPKVGEVARKWSFGSESAFNRAFKAAYGITPTQARAASRLSPLLTRARDDEKLTPLTRWMMNLSATGKAEG